MFQNGLVSGPPATQATPDLAIAKLAGRIDRARAARETASVLLRRFIQALDDAPWQRKIEIALPVAGPAIAFLAMIAVVFVQG